MFKHGLALTIVFTVLFACVPDLIAGPVYQNPASGYSITVPDGWTPLSKDKLDAIAAGFAAAAQSSHTTLDAGYAPDGKIGPSVQFLIVLSLPNPNDKQVNSATMDQFMKGVTSGLMKSSPPGTKIESSNLDKVAKTYTAHALMPVNGIKLHAGMFGFFGQKGIVQICTYSTDASHATADVKYDQVARSFRFDPGFNYDSSQQHIRQIFLAVVSIVLIGGIVLVIIVAVRASRRRSTAVPFAYGGGGQQFAPPPGSMYPPPPAPPAPMMPPPLPPQQWPPR